MNDLNVILVDSNSPVEERREAAKLLGEHGIGPNAPRAVVGLLIAARNDGDLQVRLLALQSIRWLAPALGPSGPDAVIPELKEIQEQERHSGVQAFIDEVIKAYEAQRPEEPSEATPPE